MYVLSVGKPAFTAAAIGGLCLWVNLHLQLLLYVGLGVQMVCKLGRPLNVACRNLKQKCLPWKKLLKRFCKTICLLLKYYSYLLNQYSFFKRFVLSKLVFWSFPRLNLHLLHLQLLWRWRLPMRTLCLADGALAWASTEWLQSCRNPKQKCLHSNKYFTQEILLKTIHVPKYWYCSQQFKDLPKLENHYTLCECTCL